LLLPSRRPSRRCILPCPGVNIALLRKTCTCRPASMAVRVLGVVVRVNKVQLTSDVHMHIISSFILPFKLYYNDRCNIIRQIGVLQLRTINTFQGKTKYIICSKILEVVRKDMAVLCCESPPIKNIEL
jgi:hypothetical protein